VTYSNNLEKIETIRDDGLIEVADPTIAALTGRIDVRFADTMLIDLAADGTPVDLEFAYTLSAQSKLVLTAHEVYLPKPKLAVEGPGGVQASFDFRGAKNDVVGRMLTVTLTNDLDGSVYHGIALLYRAPPGGSEGRGHVPLTGWVLMGVPCHQRISWREDLGYVHADPYGLSQGVHCGRAWRSGTPVPRRGLP
jgi:Phage tail tube protein